jgi:hypothetical protein
MGKAAVSWTDARLDELADALEPLPADVAMLKATVSHWDRVAAALERCPRTSLCWPPPLSTWRTRTGPFAQNLRPRSTSSSRSPGVSWRRCSAPQLHSYPRSSDDHPG